MSKNLILIITIFAFWLFIYLTNVKEEQQKEKEKPTVEDFIPDDFQFTGYDKPIGPTKPTYIINPVKAKGEA